MAQACDDMSPKYLQVLSGIPGDIRQLNSTPPSVPDEEAKGEKLKVTNFCYIIFLRDCHMGLLIILMMLAQTDNFRSVSGCVVSTSDVYVSSKEHLSS